MQKTIVMLFTLGIILTIFMIGCSSKTSNPVVSSDFPANQHEFVLPDSDDSTDLNGHEILGLWTMNFDPATMTVIALPDRELLGHFNITSFIPTPTIVLKSYNPTTKLLDVDVTLRNPYSISGYDVRMIIYTDSIGHLLTNYDNWTALFDISGGDSINPFKAYATDVTNRKFAGMTSHTSNLKITCPGGNFNVKFAVDASYPSNCEEPYQVFGFTQHSPLYDEQDAQADVSVFVKKWSLSAPVTLWISCFEVFGVNDVYLDSDNDKFFTGVVTNFAGAAAGDYEATITASTGQTVYLFDKVALTVTEKP